MDPTMMRRWLEKHSEIDQLVEAIRLELRRGALSTARAPIEQLAARLQTEMMECVSPFSAQLLEPLRSSHRKLRQGIENLRDLAKNGDANSARRAFAVMLHRLYRYEMEEVDLIAELDGLARRAWPMEPRVH